MIHSCVRTSLTDFQCVCMLLAQFIASSGRKYNLTHTVYLCRLNWNGTPNEPKSMVGVTVWSKHHRPPRLKAQPVWELTMEDTGFLWEILGTPNLTRWMFTMMGSRRNGLVKESFILSVDVGTTSIRCHVYDKEARIRGSCTSKVPYMPYSGLFPLCALRKNSYTNF